MTLKRLCPHAQLTPNLLIINCTIRFTFKIVLQFDIQSSVVMSRTTLSLLLFFILLDKSINAFEPQVLTL